MQMKQMLPLVLVLLLAPAIATASLGGSLEQTPNQTAAPNATTTTVPETTTPTRATTTISSTTSSPTPVETPTGTASTTTVSSTTVLPTITPTTSPTPSPSPTSAPTATSTPTTRTPVPGTNITGPDTNREVETVVDEHVAILSTEYNDGTFKIRVYSDAYTSIQLVAPQDTSGDHATVKFRTEQLDSDKIVDIYITSPGPVTVWSEASREDGRAALVEKPSGGIVDGPYTGADVRNAAAGGMAGVAIAVLYEVIAAKIGASDKFGRIA